MTADRKSAEAGHSGKDVRSDLHVAILEAFREAGIYGTLH